MITKSIQGHVLKIYDSIEDMPIINFQKYNRYLLIDSCIGSDFEDIDNHITKIAKFIQTDKAAAMQELQNMRQALYFINEEVNPRHLAFAALIYEIDGEKVHDLSDDNLKAILEKLNKVQKTWVDKILEVIKKKVEFELNTYFPEFFDSAKEKEAYDKLKQRALLVLDGIINDKKNTQEIAEIDDYLLSLSKPKQFIGTKSTEVLYNKQFENMCILIAQKTNLNPKILTVLEFYTTLDQLKKQAEMEVRHARKHKR